MLDVLNEIKLLRQDMTNIHDQLRALTASVTHCQDQISNFTEFFESTSARLKLLEEKQTEITDLKWQISQIQEQLNVQSQAAIQNEVEIIGILEVAHENLTHSVLVLAHEVGVTLKEDDLDWVKRVGPKNKKNTGGLDRHQQGNLDQDRFSRPVVIRLVRKMKRDEFLKAARVRRNITAKDIGGRQQRT